MADTNSEKAATARRAVGLIPNRLIVITVGIVCFCLMGSAIFNFVTLRRLHALYLSDRGNEIAMSVESQARGAGRRNNPEFWQSLLEEKYATCSDTVAFLALVDRDGDVLAAAGKPPYESVGPDAYDSGDVFSFEETLGRSRRSGGEEFPHLAGRKIRIGLYSSGAEFIRRQAWMQLAVSGSAMIALIAISVYLIRMLNRFLELKMRETSEAHLKSLGVMAASLAHEIRNPLGSMKGLTQLAQEELPQDHMTQVRLATVVSEAERLERLVSDLLDFARPRTPQIGVFNLMDLISDVRNMLEPRFMDAGVNFQCDSASGPALLRSDAGGVRQVLLNVLMNALDATPSNGTVILRTIRDKENGAITIQVDDTGQGLSGRDPEELFQPFVTTSTRGTGLGLTISRGILEGLEGSLALSDNPQGGMRCTIRLHQAGGAATDRKTLAFGTGEGR